MMTENFVAPVNELSMNELLDQYFWSHGFEQTARERAIAEFFKYFPNELAYQQADYQRLQAFIAINPNVYGSLVATIELGKRIGNATPDILGQVLSSKMFGEQLIKEMHMLSQEQLWLYSLNAKHEILAKDIIHIGTLSTCPFHPRDIFRRALQLNAESIVIVHNHPSGQAQPSHNDVVLSQRLVNCGQLFNIAVLDSFVIGFHEYRSLREEGLINAATSLD
ncbi:DNA repair protein [Periweissella cryptocerci]|uniref:DNA repair protein n=1 Tax=Periweissella cryptocerci TaxID=2506420 RepID=A0A4P6YVC8_9LACO|nr:JAB domain-containing protein [Periweissella cryptocerci]QBO36706.1 DNA repair protein [Periweissella cryptocerci]